MINNFRYGKIILASSSPRRIEILEKEGFDVRVHPANIDETISSDLSPEDTVKTLALKKAQAVKDCLQVSEFDAPVLGADTIVYLDEIIGKPVDKKDAFKILMKLSGREHLVYTGVAILIPPGYFFENEESKHVFSEKTSVYFKKYTEDEIADYLDSNEPYDKAGAYAIQGYFSRFIDHIDGDYYNVMGLPISKIVSILSPILENQKNPGSFEIRG